jgi:hypothetical protein
MFSNGNVWISTVCPDSSSKLATWSSSAFSAVASSGSSMSHLMVCGPSACSESSPPVADWPVHAAVLKQIVAARRSREGGIRMSFS